MTTRLNALEPQKVEYCIPLWLRDLQVAASIKRVSGRIDPGIYGPPRLATREEPIAIVCFGPSLNDTWEQVKNFRYVMSCSGAHKFLVERGIIPTWHIEVDPRAHKTQLIGPPQPETEYLIASTCHKDVFDHLEGFTVKLWHVFAADDYAHRNLPPGEWAITGGSSVGLRALTMARFFGFTDLHVFGMDGCEGESGKHADVHPNQQKDHAITEYGGREFRTTASMLECARQTWHELNQMPDVKAKFYGDGLVQTMAKDYTPRAPQKPPVLGMTKPALISPEYCALNAQLHRENHFYGVGGTKHAPTVLKLAQSLKTQSVLDYGCGKGMLAKELSFPIWEYDPAIPEKSAAPRPADLVVCTDVLEHIEPDRLSFVLSDLSRCVKMVGYFVIHTGPAQKTLPDGRNTHLIQQGKKWWKKHLAPFFTVASVMERGKELHVIVGPRKMVKAHQKTLKQSAQAVHA